MSRAVHPAVCAWSRRPRCRSAWLGAIFALMLLLTACDQGILSRIPPTQPPVPTQPGAPTAKPAAPSPAAAASPVAAASPRPAAAAAAPSPSPGASPAAKPIGLVVPTIAPSLPPSELSGTIKIVSSLPRTGQNQVVTNSMVLGIQMAIAETNSRLDRAIVVYEDLDDSTADRNTWDGGKEAEIANRAVNDPDVMVYIGPFNSGAARVSIPILNAANLAMISPSNTYPGLTRPGGANPAEPNVYYPSGKRNYVRVIPTDDVQGSMAALWAKQLGTQKVYVLDDGDVYGKMLAGAFVEGARKLGLQVTGPETAEPKIQDYGPLADKVKEAGPDLVYYGGITLNNASRLFKALKPALGDKAKLMGPDGIYEAAFLEEAGAAAEGLFVTFGGVPPSKLTGKGAEWYRAFKARYNVEPEAYTAYTYEATKVALDAIRRAGKKDRAAIRDALLATKDYEGILGKWSFDANGDTTSTSVTGRQVREGKFDDANAITIAPE